MSQIRVIVGFSLLLSGISWAVQGPNPAPQGDGQIRLYVYHLNEFAEIRFRDRGALNQDAITQIYKLLRSRDNDQEKPVAIALIDLIDHLQDEFRVDTIEIISGIRSSKLNETLKQNGHSVSPISLHLTGNALDIHIDEIREETLRDYLLTLKRGGVGYYGSLDFVHVDTGAFRQWGETDSSQRKLIGLLQPKSNWKLISNRNEYLPGSKLHFAWQGPAIVPTNKIKDMHLEHFFRGRWRVVSQQKPPMNERNFSLNFDDNYFRNQEGAIRYGKYRWTYHQEGHQELHSSNEFYLKRS